LIFDKKNPYFQTDGIASMVKFVADMMLGKLARWLRIIGYDTVYDQSSSLQDLVAMSNRTGAVFLTRRKFMPKEIAPANIFSVESEIFEEQFRYVVDHFHLDTQHDLFTRCLRCNVPVTTVQKNLINGRVPQKSFDGFDEFFECPVCHSVYWGGVHRTNTIKKLNEILHSTFC
jgi:uncharacterized protein with PIN domain